MALKGPSCKFYPMHIHTLGYCRNMMVQYCCLLPNGPDLYVNISAYYERIKTQQFFVFFLLYLTTNIHVFLFHFMPIYPGSMLHIGPLNYIPLYKIPRGIGLITECFSEKLFKCFTMQPQSLKHMSPPAVCKGA